MKKIVLMLIAFFLITACEKVLEIYIGLPLQPENINAVYQPGLNIFGMIKSGTTYDNSNSYFEVQQIYHIFDTTSIITVDDASIEITCYSDNDESKTYKLMSIGEGKYSRNNLKFFDGDVWTYRCTYDTVLITSETRIPNRAVILENSLKVTENQLSFVIQSDTTAFMYDIYYVNTVDFSSKRIVPKKGINTQVSFDIQFNKESPFNNLFVLAYDKKYQDYVTTSNIFFKPNAFRPRYTTVDGGYGCFCSMSSLMVELNLE